MEETSQPDKEALDMSILHQGALCQELWNLRTEGSMCDVILDTGSEQLRAHRVILSACSPYLKAFCVNPPALSQDGLVLISAQGYSFKVCLKLVEFLYTGKPVDFCGAILEEYKQLCAEWNILGLTEGESIHNGYEENIQEEYSVQKNEDCGETLLPDGLNALAGYTGEWGQTDYTVQDCHVPLEDISVHKDNSKKVKAVKQPAKRGRKRKIPEKVTIRKKRVCTLRIRLPSKRQKANDKTFILDDKHDDKNAKQTSQLKDSGPEDGVKENQETTEDQLYGGDTDVEEDIVEPENRNESEQKDIKVKTTRTLVKTSIKRTRTRRKRVAKTKIIDSENSSDETNPQSLQCRVCGVEMESKAELDKHKKKEHKNKRQAWCKICKTRFPDKNQLKAHEVANHFKEGMEMPKLYACQEEGCKYQTYNRKSWFGHKSFVHQPERSICDLCGKSLKSEASLKQHKHLVHVIALSKEYPCDSCDKIFRSVCGLQRHKVNIHSESKVREKHICPHCGLTCLNLSTMTEHLYKKHDLPPPAGKTGYKCQHCDFKSLKLREVRNHELRHFPDKQFSCDTCGRSYPTKRELSRHNRLHSDTYQVHKCPHCDYSTKYGRGALRSHIQVKHEEGRPWVCSICAYRTKLKGNLHKHIRNVHKCEVKTNWTLPKLVDGSNTDRYNVSKGVALKSVESIQKNEKNTQDDISDTNIIPEQVTQTSRNSLAHGDLETGPDLQSHRNAQIPISVEQSHTDAQIRSSAHSHALNLQSHINFGLGHSHPLNIVQPPIEKLGNKMDNAQFDILTSLATDHSSLSGIPNDPLLFSNMNI